MSINCLDEDAYRQILLEMSKPPALVTFKAAKSEKGPPVKGSEAKGETLPGPSHLELIRILGEVGETLNFITQKEEYTPDKVYRCDVTWRDFEGHSPIKVFEVEVSGNIDHALSSLMHAHDIWRPERLYLVISDEGDLDRAKRLVEPRMRGAFSKIRGKLRVHVWTDIKKLHANLDPYKNLVKDLTER